MPTDTFPEINIAVVTIVWLYTGLNAPEMAELVTPTRHPQYRGPSAERHLRSEGFLSARCEARSRNFADRIGHQFHSR